MAGWLHRWKLLDGTPNEIAAQLEALTPSTAELSHADPLPYNGAPLRLPAQWEPIDRVLLRWGVVYPWAWPMFAQMVHALLPVIKVEVVVPSEWWARAVLAYLQLTDGAPHVCFLITPTDDIWIRDYGPLSGRTADGQPALVDMIYHPLPRYPQAADDGFNRRYAAHHGLPLAHLPLHFEGGNLWSDGQGTLITTDHALSANRRNGQRALTPDELLNTLRRVLTVEKLLITPRMHLEETGHVDLVAKLADATTVLVTAPDHTSAVSLKAAEQVFRQQTTPAVSPMTCACCRRRRSTSTGSCTRFGAAIPTRSRSTGACWFPPTACPATTWRCACTPTRCPSTQSSRLTAASGSTAAARFTV